MRKISNCLCSFSNLRLYAVFLAILLVHRIVTYLYFDPLGDATILFCFSDNFADTGVISYFPGGEPAEGATDFLWMILIAGLYKIGIPSFLATQMLSIFGFLTLMIYLSKIYRFYHKKQIPKYIIIITFFALLASGMYYQAVLRGFSVYFYGASIMVFLYYYLTRQVKKVSITALVICLIRPDGVVLVAPLCLFMLLEKIGRKRSFSRILKNFMIYAILPGMLYFMIRWWYFGEFLPLPFLVKADTSRTIILHSLLAMFEYMVIFAVLMAIHFREYRWRPNPKTDYGIIIGIVCSMVFYATIRLEQNVGERFFIGMLLLLFVWSIAMSRSRGTLILLVVLFFSSSELYLGDLWVGTRYESNLKNIALDLKKISREGKILTCEAGNIAYYSKWETVDFWGLNTAKYAKGTITSKDVKEYNPDLVVFYSFRREYFNKNDSAFCFKKVQNPFSDQSSKRNLSRRFHNILMHISRANYRPFIVPRAIARSSLFYLIRKKGVDNHVFVNPTMVFLNGNANLFEEMKAAIIKNGGKTVCDFLSESGFDDRSDEDGW